MPSKNAQAYELIRVKLFSGNYMFGEAISVKELSEETGISRQPIMTALYRLQEQGFVEIIAQVGCKVVQPELQTVLDFYEMFAAIESVLVGFAAQRAQPTELYRLKSLHAQISALNPSHPQVEQHYRQLNIEFHKELHTLAKSPQVSLRQQANFDLSDFYLLQTQSFKQNLPFAGHEHQSIILAIENKDNLQAAQLAREHILNVAENIKKTWRKSTSYLSQTRQ